MTFGEVIKNYKKLVALFASMVIFLGVFTIIQYQTIQDRQVSKQTSISSLKDLEWQYVWQTSIALRQQSTEKITLIGSEIKSQILESYRVN